MKLKTILFFCLSMLLTTVSTFAQCPMCKKSAEGSDMAAGINLGVLYLLLIPIVLVSVAIVVYLKNKETFR